MTHDELLGNLNSPNFQNSRTLETAYLALRAIVQLHKPFKVADEILCAACCEHVYLTGWPCLTIKAIEKQLQW